MSEATPSGAQQRPRHLLPKPGTRSPATSRPVRPKRELIPAACDTCRKHKTKCNGERPACGRCVLRCLNCHYPTLPGETRAQSLSRRGFDLQNRALVYQEVLELLRTLPEQDAKQVLQRIRSGGDLEAILNQVSTGDILLQMAVMPETRFRYDFPFHSRMPDVYIPNNPYLESMLYETTSLYSGQSRPQLAPNLRAAGHQNLYLMPFHAAKVVDPRLEVRISSWTTVCKDDVLMRELLAVFLRCEYQFTAVFQKDYFLEDMAAQKGDFCSPLLVNVVLGYACVCYPRFSDRAEYWNPDTLAYRFFAEARRIWELEAAEPRVSTIQSGILFSVYYNLCGLDEIGQAYRVHAIALAHKLGLFDDDRLEKTRTDSERLANGRAFTAWALYNWETLVGFSFMQPPLLTEPPWPLPDPATCPEWYGEIWVQYPLSQDLLPSHFGHVIMARSRFRIIMNEFCQAAYKESRVDMTKANELHYQLRTWYDGLSTPLRPIAIVLPGHLQLHIYYHHLILTIYEPLLSTTALPQRIVDDSRRYLETLVRLYYLRHGFDAMDLFIVIPLMVMGSDCVDALDAAEQPASLQNLQSTLILIAKGLDSQRRNHYLAEALFRVIRGRMRSQEVVLLKGIVDTDDETDEKKSLVQAVRSRWPVSVVKHQKDLDSHILTNLVESYAHLNIQSIGDAG